MTEMTKTKIVGRILIFVVALWLAIARATADNPTEAIVQAIIGSGGIVAGIVAGLTVALILFIGQRKCRRRQRSKSLMSATTPAFATSSATPPPRRAD